MSVPLTISSKYASDSYLLKRYHVDQDLEARRLLVERMLPFVQKIARRYLNRGELLEDLVQVGCIGLLKAIDRFDVRRGAKLRTFAEPNIAGEIKRYFRDHGWSIRVPRDIQELNARMTREITPLTGKLGRTPSIEEIAEHLETSPEKVMEAKLGAQNYNTASLNEALEDTEEPLAFLGKEDSGYERTEQLLALTQGASSLPKRQREIVFLRFYKELAQGEIAKQIGISQMHVSRLLRSSLKTMREQSISLNQ